MTTREKVQALLTAANTATGETDTDLTAAVQKLIDGYGQGDGSPTASAKEVNFIDYDGTIRYSYTAAEFAALSALPANPTHDGLTAQGWNWTLADAKTYVATYGRLWIGQMYITDDGKTRVYIHLEEGRTSPILGCCPNGTVDVDWGDGTTHDTLTGTSISTVQWTPTHNYVAPGDYVIKLTVTGSMGFYGDNSVNTFCGLLRYSSSADTRNYTYKNAIRRIEIGADVTSIGQQAFYNCFSLSSITIPSGVTSIENRSFQACLNLSSITIPSGVTSIETTTFQQCYCSYISVPKSLTSIGTYAFYYWHSLSSITIPSGVTSIGNFAFYYCYSLSSITIPSGVTSIGSSAFYQCYGLAFIRFLGAVPPTVSKSNAFTGLPTDCKIYVPHGKLSVYTSATNYPSSSTYTYVEDPA